MKLRKRQRIEWISEILDDSSRDVLIVYAGHYLNSCSDRELLQLLGYISSDTRNIAEELKEK